MRVVPSGRYGSRMCLRSGFISSFDGTERRSGCAHTATVRLDSGGKPRGMQYEHQRFPQPLYCKFCTEASSQTIHRNPVKNAFSFQSLITLFCFRLLIHPVVRLWDYHIRVEREGIHPSTRLWFFVFDSAEVSASHVCTSVL